MQLTTLSPELVDKLNTKTDKKLIQYWKNFALETEYICSHSIFH